MGKYWTVILVAVLLLVAIAFAQQSPKATVQTLGRFSLIQAEIPGQIPSGNAREPGLFVIDTQTGQVWEYVPTNTVFDAQHKNGFATAEHFSPMAFQEKPYLTEGQVDRPQ
jgi:hypothetical protein